MISMGPCCGFGPVPPPEGGGGGGLFGLTGGSPVCGDTTT